MDFINKIFSEFEKPESFKNKPYSWLTNQIGHISFSFILCHYTGLWLGILLFWIIWEINHLIESRDFKDFIEDVFFEVSGVLIFLYGNTPLNISITVLLLLFVYRVYKKSN